MRSILELFTQDSDATSKVLPTTFHRSTRLCCHSLKLGFILSPHDLYVKIIFNLTQEFLTKKLSQNSSQSHIEKIKVLGYVSKYLIKKC